MVWALPGIITFWYPCYKIRAIAFFNPPLSYFPYSSFGWRILFLLYNTYIEVFYPGRVIWLMDGLTQGRKTCKVITRRYSL